MMKKILRNAHLFALLGVFLFPMEVHMSQIDYQSIPHNWSHSMDNAPVIVIARKTGSLQKIQERVFPKETHITQSAETIWQEWAQPFVILEIIRPFPGRPLGPGQEILVWHQQEYSWEDLESYHRTGIIHSLSVLIQEAEEPVKDGRVLLFLEPHEHIWRPYNFSPEEGEALLERRTREQLFTPENL